METGEETGVLANTCIYKLFCVFWDTWPSCPEIESNLKVPGHCILAQ